VILIGIAVDKGLIQSIDQAIGAFLKSTVPDLKPEVYAITIRQLCDYI
jgi:hypothetical protein